MSNSDIEQSGTVKGHLPNEASLSGRISNGLSLSGHISIGGAGDFVIKMTVESDGYDNYTVTSCDATIEQIDAAVADEKRVVVIASVDDFFLLELPMIQRLKDYSYCFGTFLNGQMITSFVEKSSNTSEWRFIIGQIGAESVGYSNEALPNTSTVGGALDALVPKSHTHSNKDTLDKFAESDGKPTYDGKEIGGAGDFIIKMTVERDDDGYFTVTSCDATTEQIDAAVSAEKRVVVIVSDGDFIIELPILQSDKGGTYYFGTFLFWQVVTSIVYKVENESEWYFSVSQIQSGEVGYYNAALPNIPTVGGALDELVLKSHTHANKDTLDKLSDSNGKLQYNGSDVGLKGDKGDTPVKGTDYWTETDKAEIVADTLAALPTWTGGSY